ncbi:hypothetical protein AB1Y20_000291 [Prymnesium parvum]|uniref:EF-hand domain-containing protein n=1 Tax=Prymnesium parvum TaxID=97485 RepID=A0AB34K815_PRYPA
MQVGPEAVMDGPGYGDEREGTSVSSLIGSEANAPSAAEPQGSAFSLFGQEHELLSREAEKYKPTNAFAALGENLGISPLLDASGKHVRRAGNFTAKQVDKAMVSNAKVVLKLIGTKLNAQLHDDPMPVFLHRAINTVFATFWPEVQKGVLDKLLLEKGWQFRNYRNQMNVSQANMPSGFRWFHATLIYSQMPYDRSFWGLIRSPLFLFVRLVFLFPLFGIDSICVIAYWLAAYKFDDHQLVKFIIKSKSLAFITSGLFASAIGFIKLFLCATRWEPHGPESCEAKAPGMNATFWFEYFLYLVRTVLVWITFLLLWRFDEIKKWKKRRDAERNRMAAIERRGLLSVRATRAFLLCTWLLSWYNMIAVLQAADYFSAVNKIVHAAQHEQEVSAIEFLWSEQQEMTMTPLEAAVLIFVFQQLPCSYLLNVPQMKPTLARIGLCTSLFVLVFLVRNLYISVVLNDELHKNVNAVIANVTLFALNTSTMIVMCLLIKKQRDALKEDQAAIERFARVMVRLDRDGDGEVTKAEFRLAFKELFPNAKFEPVWKKLDQDGDGSLSMAELANHFGMGHLVKEQEVVVEKKPDSDDDMDAMMSVETMLNSTVEASALSNRAGGVLAYFLIWDLISFFLVGTLVIIPRIRSANDTIESQWRLRTGLYFSKQLLGLFSLPFIIFQIPVIKDALTHTKQSGYNRAGECVAVLSKADQSKRYAVQQKLREERYARMLAGEHIPFGEAIELYWNAFLGFPALDKKARTDTKANGKSSQKWLGVLPVNRKTDGGKTTLV